MSEFLFNAKRLVFTRRTNGVILLVCVAAMAYAGSLDEWFNFGETLSWTPGKMVECDSVDCVIATVSAAKSDNQRVKVFGTGWSWSTTIASDGDTYIQLTGDLADASQAEFDLDALEPSVIVGGGVVAFDLYMELQDTGFDIEAKGNCLAASESQTVGGLLATNVHHTGIKTFYDVVEWVEVVTANGLVRTQRDETLFRITIGAAGRTGIIVRVKFLLAPRATYEDVGGISQPDDDSFETFFQDYVDLTNGYEPMEFIAEGVRVPSITSLLEPTFSAKRRMAEPSPNPAVLPSNYGDLSFFIKTVLLPDPLLDLLLPADLFDIYYTAMIGRILTGEQPDRDGKDGEDLDVACSRSTTQQLKHQEIEFFVPVDLLGEVGAFLDKQFAHGFYPYVYNHALVVLRKVFGSNSLTAANGVLSDGSTPDYVAVNVDGYQRSKWKKFNAEINEMMADLSQKFPLLIRTHPGKYNAPLSPDPESQPVKDLIDSFDPQGVFARDAYDPTYLTEPPREADDDNDHLLVS